MRYYTELYGVQVKKKLMEELDDLMIRAAPELYQVMRESGQLEEGLRWAVGVMYDNYTTLQSIGMSPDQAMAIAQSQRRYLCLNIRPDRDLSVIQTSLGTKENSSTSAAACEFIGP